MVCHHNILFGSVLKGDIGYKCTMEMKTVHPGYVHHRGMLSVGLVESAHYHYLGEHMHSGLNNRCLFAFNGHYDGDGNRYEYDEDFVHRNHTKYHEIFDIEHSTLSITNMSTFHITESFVFEVIVGFTQLRVLCSECKDECFVSVYISKLSIFIHSKCLQSTLGFERSDGRRLLILPIIENL